MFVMYPVANIQVQRVSAQCPPCKKGNKIDKSISKKMYFCLYLPWEKFFKMWVTCFPVLGKVSRKDCASLKPKFENRDTFLAGDDSENK